MSELFGFGMALCIIALGGKSATRFFKGVQTGKVFGGDAILG